MTPESLSVGLAALAFLGQLVNAYLNLRIRNALLELEVRILHQVDERYTPRELCAARHASASRTN